MMLDPIHRPPQRMFKIGKSSKKNNKLVDLVDFPVVHVDSQRGERTDMISLPHHQAQTGLRLGQRVHGEIVALGIGHGCKSAGLEASKSNIIKPASYMSRGSLGAQLSDHFENRKDMDKTRSL